MIEAARELPEAVGGDTPLIDPIAIPEQHAALMRTGGGGTRRIAGRRTGPA